MFVVGNVRASKVWKLIIEAVKQENKEIVNDLNSQDINEDHIDIDSDIFRETP